MAKSKTYPNGLKKELIKVKKQLQQEQVVTKDFKKSLKTVHNATQKDIELIAPLKRKLDIAKAKNKTLFQ